ncbi:MAG: hypothetical protein V3W05_01295 [candidate division NC10 bacterium]
MARIAPLIVLGALLAFPADPAEVYRAQGKYADGERLAQRALNLVERDEERREER